MTFPIPVPGNGLVFEGHGYSRSAARAAALDWLVEVRNVDEFDAETVTETASVVRAYWAGPEIGFVTLENPSGVPVTVVVIPDPLLAEPT